MENIKNIAEDFLDDAIDAAKFDERKFFSWSEFVEDAFFEAAANNVLPGYDNDDVAANVLFDNRLFVGKFVDDVVRSCGSLPVNPFLNPTGFLVYMVTRVAEGMEAKYADMFAEIRIEGGK